jgi:hypothetical protein
VRPAGLDLKPMRRGMLRMHHCGREEGVKMKYFGMFLTSLPLTLLAGCAASTGSLQSASSGAIGCSRSEISISDYRLNMYTSSWTAACKGKVYFCSGSDTLKQGASCKQAQER